MFAHLIQIDLFVLLFVLRSTYLLLAQAAVCSILFECNDLNELCHIRD